MTHLRPILDLPALAHTLGQPDRLRCSLLSRPDILPASAFVARARTLASLGLKIVAVWEQSSPDPEKLSYSSGDSDAFSANIFLVWRAARESHPTIAVALQWSVSQVRASELRCWMSAIGAPRTVALMLQLSAKRNLTLRSDTRAVRSFARARLWLSSQRLEDAEPPRYHR